MAEKYKLIYFNARARAEPIRLLLALAGVEYEDHRINITDWSQHKAGTKWGFLPVLEVNGEPMGEISAILCYLSKKYGLAGQTLMEQFRAEELMSAFSEVLKIRPVFIEQDPAKKEELKKAYVDGLAKPVYAKVTEIKEKNGGKWLVGQNLTIADLFIAHGMTCAHQLDPTLIDEFPVLKKLQEEVFAIPQIKKWLETRPQTAL